MIMRRTTTLAALVGCLLASSNLHAQSTAQPTLDNAAIERITGWKGAMNTQENVFKVSQPRTDVQVKVDGRPLEPFMGLTSWASFMPGKAEGVQAMVMGDLVVFQDEVNPAMDALFKAGLSVTALHNHFFHAEPSVYFMHIGGEGNVEMLAQGVEAAADAVKSIRAKSPQPSAGGVATQVPTTNSVSAERIKGILGVDGTAKDGMFKAVIGRTVKMPCGCTIGKEMGVNTWAAFAGSDERAIVDGDFVTFEGELQPVLKALRSGGINIVAIHNHMEGESPKAIFLHYWGVGAAEDLARTVRAALDAQQDRSITASAQDSSNRHSHYSFEDGTVGSLPSGWRVGTTGDSEKNASWQIIKDDAGSANQTLSLVSQNHASNSAFNVCWTNESKFLNGTVEVRVRANQGKVDQGGGPIWRVIDQNNYYMARYNPLETNLRVYIVQDGKRRQLASAEKLDTRSGEWFTIKISHIGKHIECSLNGKNLLKVDDETIGKAGGIGVWTKADAQTSFDDLVIHSTD
jgi:hypothetical protein